MIYQGSAEDLRLRQEAIKRMRARELDALLVRIEAMIEESRRLVERLTK